MGLFNSLKKYDDSLEKKAEEISGVLGIRLGGEKVVEHPTRNGFVYVRLRDNLSEVVHAFNDKVSPVFDLPVKIQRRNNKWYIIGRDVDRYSNWGSSAPFLPKHGFQHSFNRDLNTGGDVVEVYPDQFIPALVYPSGTVGAGNLMVANHLLQRTNDFLLVGGTGTVDLLPYKPTGSSAVLGLVYLDRVNGNVGVLINSGSHASAVLTGTSVIAPYIPYPNSVTQEPLYAFRLVSGTDAVGWSNLYNARQFFSGRQTGTSSGGGGLGGTGTITGKRVVITDSSGTITTDPQFYYDKDSNVIVLGDSTIVPTAFGNSTFWFTEDGVSPALALATYGENFAPFQTFFKANGSAASPTALTSGTVIGRIRGRGFNGTAWSNTQAEIRYRAGQDWGLNGHPEDIAFLVTPTGSTSLTELASFRHDGVFYLADASRASADNGFAFQRNMERNLVLQDGESLVVASYLNMNGYDIIMSGDSELRLI